MYTEDQYKEFQEKLETKFPEMFSQPYGGFSIGPGWWHIIEALCGHIYWHIDHVNKERQRLLENNPHDRPLPDEIPPVVVAQIKEKFGGLRFYYDGGDDKIDGMVQMAEAWASHTCEKCGSVGTRRTGGWIRTLCDTHDEQYRKSRDNTT